MNINVFHSEEEALAKANDTEYGLYAAVYTKNIDRAMRFAQDLEAGSVGVNCTSPVTAVDLPFGGYKASGLGREGIKESLDNFLEFKTVMIKVSSWSEVCTWYAGTTAFTHLEYFHELQITYLLPARRYA